VRVKLDAGPFQVDAKNSESVIPGSSLRS